MHCTSVYDVDHEPQSQFKAEKIELKTVRPSVAVRKLHISSQSAKSPHNPTFSTLIRHPQTQHKHPNNMQTTTTTNAYGDMATVQTKDMHRHETAKGAAGGAALASVIPGVGTVVGGAIGAAVGHHKKKQHEREGTHQYT
ncbi:exported protein of unknown function [Planoprotostelium fungivorum]|uniref:Glycine zipper domain-containing protein n=1 Tax=Planoprotostelium fungivorum TaxID=1890364 RepID=A0A2P6NQP0_9EUKA|nr:exported protein of unknown function [Planoprotostelium fungivorum]